MKKLTVYVTRDGKQHASTADATKHADRRYGDLLRDISTSLLRPEGKLRHIAIEEYLDANLDKLRELLAWKKDQELQREDDGDEDEDEDEDI